MRSFHAGLAGRDDAPLEQTWQEADLRPHEYILLVIYTLIHLPVHLRGLFLHGAAWPLVLSFCHSGLSALTMNSEFWSRRFGS